MYICIYVYIYIYIYYNPIALIICLIKLSNHTSKNISFVFCTTFRYMASFDAIY